MERDDWLYYTLNERLIEPPTTPMEISAIIGRLIQDIYEWGRLPERH